jgi:hypothetical protein
VTIVGGRLGPNFAEFFVLAPVPSLTALETLVTQVKKGKRNDSTLSQYLADLDELGK